MYIYGHLKIISDGIADSYTQLHLLASSLGISRKQFSEYGLAVRGKLHQKPSHRKKGNS
jgi:hypothetical protein